MANEEGGVVTTVKEETTKDQDVVARLAEENQGTETPAGEKPDTSKPAAEAKPKTEIKQPTLDDDDDYVPLDINSLDPKQQAAARRLYQQRRKANQRADRLEDEVRQLREQVNGKSNETKTEAAPKPDLSALGERPKPPDPKTWKGTQEEFDKEYEKYEDARDEWSYKRRRAEEKAQEAQTAQQTRNQQIVEAFQTAQTSFAEAHPDYQDVIDNDIPMTDVMFGFVLKHGPEVLYEMGQHQQEARRIAKLTDTDEAIEALLRIKFRLELQKEAAEKAAKEAEKGQTGKPATTKEKPEDPPKPVGGRTAPVVQKDRSKMTFKERERERFRQNPGAFNYEP